MFNLLNGAKSTDKTSAIDKAVDAFMKVNGDISEQVKKIAIPQGLVIGKAIDENPFNPKRKDEKEQWNDYMSSRGLLKMDKNNRKICRNAHKARKAINAYMASVEDVTHRSLEMTTRNALKIFDLEGNALPEKEKDVTTLKEDVAKFFKTQCKKRGMNSHELYDAINDLFDEKQKDGRDFDQHVFDATTEFSTKNVVNE